MVRMSRERTLLVSDERRRAVVFGRLCVCSSCEESENSQEYDSLLRDAQFPTRGRENDFVCSSGVAFLKYPLAVFEQGECE